MIEYLETILGGLRNRLGFQETLEGSFRLIVFLDEFGFHSLLLDKLGGRKEEVEKPSPLRCVELVKVVNGALLVETIIAEILTNVRPIFSFHVSVIVFLILP
mgnify:CR=1 FL=1